MKFRHTRIFLYQNPNVSINYKFPYKYINPIFCFDKKNVISKENHPPPLHFFAIFCCYARAPDLFALWPKTKIITLCSAHCVCVRKWLLMKSSPFRRLIIWQSGTYIAELYFSPCMRHVWSSFSHRVCYYAVAAREREREKGTHTMCMCVK